MAGVTGAADPDKLRSGNEEKELLPRFPGRLAITAGNVEVDNGTLLVKAAERE